MPSQMDAATNEKTTPRAVSRSRAVANRRNAEASTGPRTPAGKQRAAGNATTHGLLVRRVLLPDESTEEYLGFRLGLMEALEPAGALELVLVERVIAAAWRLRRALRVEADLANQALADQESWEAAWTALPDPEADAPGPDAGDGTGEMPRTPVPSGLARAWQHQGPGADRLVRYETALERSLYRALHELERVQRARAGAPVGVPHVVDAVVYR